MNSNSVEIERVLRGYALGYIPELGEDRLFRVTKFGVQPVLDKNYFYEKLEKYGYVSPHTLNVTNVLNVIKLPEYYDYAHECKELRENSF